jgi:hypothetical protein
MGTFGNSFSREIGKNTGKLVSNAVFGDKWSTPHRITSTVKVAEIKAEQAKLEASALKEKAEIEYDLQIDKIKLEQKFEKQKAEDSILDDIVRANFNTDKDSIFQVLTDLYSLSESTENQKIKKAANEKINAGIFKLEQIGAKVEADYFNNKFREKKIQEEEYKLFLNNKLKTQRIIPIVGCSIFLVSIIIFQISPSNPAILGGLLGLIILYIGLKKYLKVKKELNK